MRVRAHACWLPKAGNTDAEYEDAVWPLRATEVEGRRFQCAVADGASETSFARLWAMLLVRAYCRNQATAPRLNGTLQRLRRQWGTNVRARPLPWYAEEKAQMGAFSTLTGLTLVEVSPGRITWHALAVGDSCLFHLRGDTLLSAFPLSSSANFSSRPYLLSSKPQSPVEPSALLRTGGEGRPGDLFVLTTDALGCWFLGRWEAGEALSELVRAGGVLDVECFAASIEKLRCTRAIRNDDVSLLRVEVM